jgi:hypothetical protein
MVLISIFRLTNDIAHSFMFLLAIHMYCFLKYTFKCFIQLYTVYFCLLLNYKDFSVYSRYVICLFYAANIFIHSVACLFVPLMLSCDEQKFLILLKKITILVFFLVHTFHVLFKKTAYRKSEKKLSCVFFQ